MLYRLAEGKKTRFLASRMEIITRHQCAAARAILELSLSELADQAGVSATSISAFENGKSEPKTGTLKTLRDIFEQRGIEFLADDGVKRRTAGIKLYEGRDGFVAFFEDVYETVRDRGGEVCVSNVDEHEFGKWLGSAAAPYKAKMADLKNLNFKSLIREGDDYFAGGRYAEYRWVSADEFDRVPYYAYGDKLAIILFGKSVSVYVIQQKEITDAFRASFNRQWTRAKVPSVPGRLDP
jgi:transcriptional regulator with XRE-family HTH domain